MKLDQVAPFLGLTEHMVQTVGVPAGVHHISQTPRRFDAGILFSCVPGLLDKHVHDTGQEITGGVSTLLEWDEDLPAFPAVHAEVLKARAYAGARPRAALRA